MHRLHPAAASALAAVVAATAAAAAAATASRSIPRALAPHFLRMWVHQMSNDAWTCSGKLPAALLRNGCLQFAWMRVHRRLQAKHIGHDAADAHVQAVFEVHHDRILAHEQGLTRMSVSGFLRVLRECALLDNATAPTDADRIFTQQALQQPQPPRKGLGEAEVQVREGMAVNMKDAGTAAVAAAAQGIAWL